ncbi:hypothetical protein K0M31_012858 [Melipona bicolor]|uniref:Uncharacterized protein n=1 Tax=Melipona bicolor TaxID=60889 RepID=A0AA40KH59_9HYME|nr:hypothetical protein K0M31_012858 [Melipona bicolor]
MKEVEDGEVIGLLKDEDGRGNLERRLEDGWRTRKDQIIQKNWSKINKLRYCPELKTEWNQKSYWENKEIKWRDKEQWARMRCENIGRAGNKVFKKEKCRLCNGGTENLEHAWTCVEIRKMIKEELVNKVEAEINKVNERGRNGWKALVGEKLNLSYVNIRFSATQRDRAVRVLW